MIGTKADTAAQSSPPTLAQRAATRRIAISLACLFAAVFVQIAVVMAYLPLWFAAAGFSATAVATLTALPMLARIVTAPLIGAASDAMVRPHRLLIALACTICALGVSLAIFAPPVTADGTGGALTGTAPSLQVFLLAGVACGLVVLLQSMIPLSENLTLLAVRGHRVAYGPVRLWGSAALILGTLVGGFTIQAYAAGAIPILLGGCGLLLAMAALWAPRLTANELDGPAPNVSAGSGVPTDGSPLPAQPSGAATHMTDQASTRWSGWRQLLNDRRFIMFGVATALVQASHAMLYAFGSVHWVRSGITPDIVGWLWTVGVLAEIALFAVADRLPFANRPAVWLTLGAVAGLVRWPLTALDPPLAGLFALQLLHGLTFGATHLAAMTYIAQFVPARLGATAQSAISALGSGVLMGGAMWMSGPLYANFAGLAYVAMAVLAAVGLMLGVRAMRRPGRRRRASHGSPAL
ncbi:MAG: MFS transporter [Pseudomonadota bacterium]